MLSLSGRGAIVAGTRAPAGALLRKLSAEGVSIALIHHGDEAGAKALLPAITSHVKGVCLIDADLTSEEDVKRAVSEAKRELGDLSFCINLGSSDKPVRIEQPNGAGWDAGMLAAKSAYLLTLHAGLAMTGNEGPTRGQIIELVERVDIEAASSGEMLPYLTAQASISFMTRAFALELAGWGILVNSIASQPGTLEGEAAEAELAELILTLLRLETVTGEEIRVTEPMRPRPAL